MKVCAAAVRRRSTAPQVEAGGHGESLPSTPPPPLPRQLDLFCSGLWTLSHLCSHAGTQHRAKQMGERPAPPVVGTCGAGGGATPPQPNDDDDDCDGHAIQDSLDPASNVVVSNQEEHNADYSSSSSGGEEKRETAPPPPTAATGGAASSASRAVQLLDEELAELEQLIHLQRRRVDALERLRNQWLSGERCIMCDMISSDKIIVPLPASGSQICPLICCTRWCL